MKMTNIDAYTCLNTMATLKESGKLGFAIAKNMRKLSDELTEFIEKRKELFNTYGTETDSDVIIPPENIPAFIKVFDEYASIEFEFQPQTVSEEIFCGGSLTSDQMFQLYWMVK